MSLKGALKSCARVLGEWSGAACELNLESERKAGRTGELNLESELEAWREAERAAKRKEQAAAVAKVAGRPPARRPTILPWSLTSSVNLDHDRKHRGGGRCGSVHSCRSSAARPPRSASKS